MLAVVIAAVIVIANVALALLGSSVAAVVAGVVLAVAAVTAGRLGGLSWDQLGLSRDRLLRGLGVGAVAAFASIALGAAALAIPPTRDVLATAGATGADPLTEAYVLLVRIPVGTALVEELLFRAALFGALRERYGEARGMWWTAIAFGLWHVLPAIAAGRDVGAFGAVAGAVGPVVALAVIVAATTLAGAVFGWLRVRGKHVAAAVLAHAAINMTAYAVVELAAA